MPSAGASMAQYIPRAIYERSLYKFVFRFVNTVLEKAKETLINDPWGPSLFIILRFDLDLLYIVHTCLGTRNKINPIRHSLDHISHRSSARTRCLKIKVQLNIRCVNCKLYNIETNISESFFNDWILSKKGIQIDSIEFKSDYISVSCLKIYLSDVFTSHSLRQWTVQGYIVPEIYAVVYTASYANCKSVRIYGCPPKCGILYKGN